MKKILIGSIVIALAVAGIAVMMLLSNVREEVKEEAKVDTKETTTEKASEVGVPISGSDTMTALMARGENLECSVSYYSDEAAKAPTTGTFFTSRGRLRGDFLIPDMGPDAVSSMIMRDETMYSWTVVEGEKYGMKISMKDLEASKTTDNTPEAREVVPLEAKVDYNCKVWSPVDGSVFETPNDVIFQDFNNVMNAGMDFGTVYEGGAGASASVNQCAMCDQIKGEGKAECKAMFSCQ
jgi:hypothetical protein